MAAITEKVRRTKKEVVAEFRCKTILEAARAVFARKGFEAALVDDIAEEAGIAKGTIYLYFPSKKDIYLAALVEELQRFHEQTLYAVNAVTGTRDKIRAFAQVGLANCSSHGDFLRIYVSEFSHQFEDCSQKPKELARIHQKRVSLLTAIIEDGIKEGQIKPVRAGAAAATVFDVLRGMWYRQLLGQSGVSAQQELESILDFIWNGLAVA
jgi:TetR/AcrR family fatty acid metabolism transcriptional regulator